MWEGIEDIDPFERQHHVDFAPTLYLVKKELLEHEASKNPQAKEALDAIENAQAAVDLGCGSGYSTKALSEMCEKLQTVDMVDGKPVISNDIVDELTKKGVDVSTFQSTQIHDYLGQTKPNSKDIIFFGGVLNHNLSPEDIEKMSLLLNENGIVFETDQTNLDASEMRKYFDKLYERNMVSRLADVVWRKKSKSE